MKHLNSMNQDHTTTIVEVKCPGFFFPFRFLDLSDSPASYLAIFPENQHFCFKSKLQVEILKILVSGA